MIKTIGNHRVKNGYVEQGIDDLMQGVKADIFYCDPPWGAGTYKYWETKNKKDTGVNQREVDYLQALNTMFITAANHSKNLCFIEYGVKWRNDVILAGEDCGYTLLGVASPLYKSGSKWLKQDLIIFAKNPNTQLPLGYIESLENTKGLELLENALLPFVHKYLYTTILDPYCGLGTTAQFAQKYNLTFYGNEMNAKRILKTYEKLS